MQHSALEIRRVASLFPGRGQATVRIGDAATEAQLQRDDREGTLARHRYLLLSAHGYLSLKAPSLSVLDGWWLEGWIEGVTGWAVGGDA